MAACLEVRYGPFDASERAAQIWLVLTPGARRSTAADRKAATKTTTDELPARSFGDLLDHLATLTRNDIQYLAVEGTMVSQLALPTPTQRRVFELLEQPIPLNLT